MEQRVEGQGKTRTKKGRGLLEVQDNLEVDELTINEKGCWVNPQMGIFQHYVDNYASLEESLDAPQLVHGQGLCVHVTIERDVQ